MPPLNNEELGRYYAESKVLAGLFGLPASALPATGVDSRPTLRKCFRLRLWGVSERARFMGSGIMSGAGSRIHIPRWYQALTAEGCFPDSAKSLR